MHIHCYANKTGTLYRIHFVMSSDFSDAMSYQPAFVHYNSFKFKKMAIMTVIRLINGEDPVVCEKDVESSTSEKLDHRFGFLSDQDDEYVNTYFVSLN